MIIDVTLEQDKSLDVQFNETLAAIAGKDGLSAYEIAVKNGFVGTEQEWLNSLEASKTEVIDNLTSTDTDKALSANQGKLLNDKVKDLSLVDERLNYYGDKDIIPSDASYFTVNETGETITGLSDTGKTQTELIIPYNIKGKLITSIGSGAFLDCGSLTSITIPNSVTTIGSIAFNYCESLTSITIPNSVTSIEGSTFYNCRSLTSITTPNSLVSIGPEAFLGCTSLTSITISNSVTSIEYDAFGNCPNIKIYCEQGSYADTYAKTNNIPIVYTDIHADVILTIETTPTENSTNLITSGGVYSGIRSYIDEAILGGAW